MSGAQGNLHRDTGFATIRFDKLMVYQMIKNKQPNTIKQQYKVESDYLCRIILFFLLGWVISTTIINCTNAPIDKQVIRHGVIDYYELVEPLGTTHIYRVEPIVDETYYCLTHEAAEIIYRLDSDSILTKRVRRWVIPINE